MELRSPKIGRLNQGVIFTCAKAERYDGRQVFGLIITARCDLAQEKFPMLNYVPVVSLDDWLVTDGLDLMLSRASADTTGKLKGALKTAGIAESLLNSQSPRQIFDSFFLDDYSKGKKPAKQFFDIVEVCEFLASFQRNISLCIDNLYKQFDAQKKRLLEELIRHNLSGHYFLSRVFDGERAARICSAYAGSHFYSSQLSHDYSSGC
ncbi:hypothetical protein NKI39_29830 [Mesorhizobium sp. M0664]|uniref:hypothetical protein n=1 Tax=Mesorhizobium sp. M0664 TaxID=2956982 RepID=UPI00333B87F5